MSPSAKRSERGKHVIVFMTKLTHSKRSLNIFLLLDMEFRKPREKYLNRLSGGIFQKLRSSSVPSGIGYTSAEGDETRDFQLHKQRIEAELELITKETLSRPRRRSSGYCAVTIPSSVKHQVIEIQSAMARPRSPPRKKEVDHVYLQGLLDDQLSVIRQQLVSLLSARVALRIVRVHISAVPCTSSWTPG